FRHVVAGSAAVACSWAACRPDGYAGEDYLSCTGVDVANYTAGVRAYHACGTTQDGPDLRRHKQREYAAQADLLRDVTGNPFRPVAFNPAWRTPTVTALATAAYEERILPAGILDPDRLAVLADALEDAGCNDAD